MQAQNNVLVKQRKKNNMLNKDSINNPILNCKVTGNRIFVLAFYKLPNTIALVD